LRGRRRPRWRLLSTPEEIVESYLTSSEKTILVDEPATTAFLVEAANEIAIIVAIALLTGFLVGKGGGMVVALIGFVVIDVLAIVLIVRRVKMWYVRYVLTDFRVLRTWGVFNRHLAWIPWPKITDVSIHQTVAGRLFGYATVRIESANEASGFKEIQDLRDPYRFHTYIVEIVEEQSGTKIPDWMLRAAPGRRPD
jgi:membrane protein YdbS with pleckstrin-like domain